jgi:pimeloyl-ACP methyl ester carboxylesterase
MSEKISAFRSAESQLHYFAAYDAAMRLWPVPFESFDVTTCYGRTHIHTCGSKDASQLMLLHGGYASSTMWFPNIADLSARFRVLAVDTIGELGKSFPTQRNATNQDCAAWLESIFLEIYQPQ